ncbi:hypothetical protein HU200_007857 [Digitaria exilis]|uniref:TOD1/MUCI70 glycosyltransferase-like domain-containing protein n=1 Tax=Digitaria exilis TaxID=1010633 RepID=A0A835FPA4_9POAL|nr:hypothetical protein HU200_007857 [Digitaria exilis]
MRLRLVAGILLEDAHVVIVATCLEPQAPEPDLLPRWEQIALAQRRPSFAGVRRDPIAVLEALLWRTNSTFAISEHGARSNIYDEGKAIVQKHKATPEEVEVQLSQYRQDGMPGEKRLHGLKVPDMIEFTFLFSALAEASVIVRELTPAPNHFMCAWFNEVVRFTSRDQLSFPYVLWRLNMPGMSMFPVCTRRDLVNSLGHTRKVKPLTQTNPESSAT